MTLPPVIANNMVVQSGEVLSFWGWADGGEKVTIELGGVEVASTVGDAARIREDMRAAIIPVLTTEQRASYEKFEADRDARHDRVRSNVRDYLEKQPKPSSPTPP